MLQTYIPRLELLSITSSMTPKGAQMLGKALGGVSMPKLDRLEIALFPENWHDVDWFSMMTYSSGEPPRQERGNAIDALLRYVMHGLCDIHVPCLRKITLKGSTCRMKATSAPPRGATAEAHVQNGHAFGAALAALLGNTTRLQNLNLHTCDVGKECFEHIAPCMSSMPALTSIKLSSAEIDSVGGAALLQHVSNHTALAEISLCSCWVRDECLGTEGRISIGPTGLAKSSAAMCQWLYSLPVLQKLEFDDCDFGKQGQQLLEKNLAPHLKRVAKIENTRGTVSPHLTEPIHLKELPTSVYMPVSEMIAQQAIEKERKSGGASTSREAERNFARAAFGTAPVVKTQEAAAESAAVVGGSARASVEGEAADAAPVKEPAEPTAAAVESVVQDAERLSLAAGAEEDA